MSRYSVLKVRQMMWLLAAMLLCSIQFRSGAYGFSHQFHQKPRLRNFSVLSSTSRNGCSTMKNRPLRFGREHQGYFETLSNNPSPSFCYGYVPWRDTRSKLEAVQYAFPISHAMSTNMNSKLKANNISSADLKKKDNTVPKISYGESTIRSLVKALMWRVVAAIVTLASGIAFSKNLATAFSLVCSDFLSKAGFMFVGERLWSRVQWGQGKGGDSSQRRCTIYM